MIRSYVFENGKIVGRNLDVDALRLVRADKGLQLWVDLYDPDQAHAKMIMEQLFEFHPLAIEDCLVENQLPKVDDYGDYLFIVMHAVDYTSGDVFRTTEIDMFLSPDFLITHHETEVRSVEWVVDRLEKNAPLLSKGVDRIVYRLLDGLVDNYEPAMAELTADITALEDRIFGPDYARTDVITDFRDLRREINHLRHIVGPQRDTVYRLSRGEFKQIHTGMLPYFRDVHDSLYRLEKRAHNFSEQVMTALDVYLNRSGYETNEIIKLLTLLTVVTTPTLLFGSWYGMNFVDMPLLHYSHGYIIIASITLLSTGALILWMKLKKWL